MRKIGLALIGICFLFGCTPKIQEQVAIVPEPAPVIQPDDGDLSPCGKFTDTPLEDEAMTAHVLYRDFLREKKYDEAFPYWKRAYELAPAADGKRNTHYADGIKLYEHFISKETIPAKKDEQIDQIFKFYDEIEECYGETGYVAGRKAFDYYYKYKGRVSDEEIFGLFRKSIDTDGEDAQFFILNPFTDLLVKNFQAENIDLAATQDYAEMIKQRIAKGYDSGKNKAQWDIISEYALQRLEAFEGVKGFYDCEYYAAKYFADFEADQSNCEIINQVYGQLRRGGCPQDDARLAQIQEAYDQHCKKVVPPSDSKQAYAALREGNYEEAVIKFQEAADKTEENEKKATYLMLVAKVHYAHLKDFPKARKAALEAANFRANWGEPYLLIGRLYASSGPLCGPGRGWDSQIVVWPAIDKWNYAKKIDPEAAEEANKWIGRYRQYMPSREDIFQRNLQDNQTFRVPCWIQENTTIRAAKS